MTEYNHTKYWILSFMFSVMLLGVIGYKWFVVHRNIGCNVNIVKNESELDTLLKKFKDEKTIEFENGNDPYRIPTGFFIQSMAFVSPSDINITGYIWQKYCKKNMPLNFKKGFIFPEEVNSGDTKIVKTYEFGKKWHNNNYDMIGWYFDVTLRQSFNYSRYPLDFLTVWIRIWAKDFGNDTTIIFVPDFDAYASTNKKTFGLDMDIVPGAWEIDTTFFSYNKVPYDTDFGYFTKVTEYEYSEFYINLGLKRKFINVFIIHLVPLFIVLLLLFSQLMIVTDKKELTKKFNFSTSGSITTCSALFFVVMLAHIQVRTQFSGSGLVYLEYFYLISYIIILLVALNTYVFSLGKLKRFNLVYYHDNFIPKVIYWPLVFGMITLVTWIKL